MTRNKRRTRHWSWLLPVLAICQSTGCLPDGGFKQVVGENIVLTSAVIIQSLSSIFFNTIFGAT